MFKKLKLKRRYNKELDELFQKYLWDCNFLTSSIMMHRKDESFNECCNRANKCAKETYLRRKKEIDTKYIMLGISKEELAKWISQRKKRNQ